MGLLADSITLLQVNVINVFCRTSPVEIKPTWYLIQSDVLLVLSAGKCQVSFIIRLLPKFLRELYPRL